MCLWPCLSGDCVWLRACMHVCDYVCACVVIVWCLYVSLAMFVW